MRLGIEPSSTPAQLSASRSWPAYIISTSGYDFRKGQGFASIDDVLAHTDLGSNAVIGVGDDSITLTFVNKAALASHRFDILI
jgi:hypothetical protein